VKLHSISLGGGLVEGWKGTEQETADLCFSKSLYIRRELNFKEPLPFFFELTNIHFMKLYSYTP
jgi:hypothetical protein